MAPFSVDAWLVVGAISVICLLSFFYALATLYRDQTKLHDLKVQVHQLRREYAERVARQRAEAEAANEAEANNTPPAPITMPAPPDSAQTQAERYRPAA